MTKSKRIEELEKGCNKGFHYNHELFGILILHCGKWFEATPTHSIMERCSECQAKLEERKLAEKEFLELIDKKRLKYHNSMVQIVLSELKKEIGK